MQLKNVKRVGIIGSGVAGLATAKTLLAQDLECTVFDRADRLGGVWADGYSNFGVQAQKELYQFPDWPLPEGTPNFTPGPIFQKYLEDYVDHFELRSHIRLQSCVTSVKRRAGDTPGWTMTISADGDTYQEDFDLVVVATGLYSNIPNMPSLPGESEFQGAILHNSAVKTREPLEGRRVAVIGYGKSATDAALEAAAVAQDAHIVFRTPHWPVPRDLAGIIPFKWGMLNRMTGALINPYQRRDFMAHCMHSVGKPIAWIFWRLVELLLYFQCHLGTKIANGQNLVPSIPVEIDCFGESTMVPRPALYKSIREGRITAHRTQIDHYTENGIVLTDGVELAVDCVVFATGWKSDYGFLSEEAQQALQVDDDGFYLYRHILHPDLPNLAFIGNASTFLSVLTYSLQARWLGELIAGHIELPDRRSMLLEITEMKAWKRSWMPFSAARGARLLLHMLSYHDELLADFGANPLRKRGILAPLKELVVPYHPSDYDVIVSGDWEAIEGRSP